MRALLILLGGLFAIILIPTSGFAEDDEGEFLRALEHAFRVKDAAAIVSMHCLDGFDEAARKKKERQIPALYLRDDFKSAEYVSNADPPARYTHNGITYAPNLSPEKAILVKFQRIGSPDYSSETRLWVGRKGGNLLIILAPPRPMTSP